MTDTPEHKPQGKASPPKEIPSESATSQKKTLEKNETVSFPARSFKVLHIEILKRTIQRDQSVLTRNLTQNGKYKRLQNTFSSLHFQ